MIKSQKIKNFLECVIGKECSKTIFFPDGSIFVEKNDILYPLDVNKLVKSKDDKDFLSITSFEFIKNNVLFVLGRDCLISECQNTTAKSETVAALNDAKENNVKPLSEREKFLQDSKKENGESIPKKKKPKLINRLDKKQMKYALDLYGYIKGNMRLLLSKRISSRRKEEKKKEVKKELKNRFSCKFEVVKGGQVKIYSNVIPCLCFTPDRKNSDEALKGFLKVVTSTLAPVVKYISACGLELTETNENCASKGTQKNLVISKADFFEGLAFANNLLLESKGCRRSIKKFGKRIGHLKLFKDFRYYPVKREKSEVLCAEVPLAKCIVTSIDGNSLPSELVKELNRIYNNYKD